MAQIPITEHSKSFDAIEKDFEDLYAQVGGGYLNVKTPAFGAKGDLVANDTPAIQAAIDQGASLGIPVFIPAGNYKLSTPLIVGGGNVIIGASGRLNGFYPGATLFPTTSAFLTSNFLTWQIGFSLRNVGINGGTVQIDLGNFHEVDLCEVEFFNPSVGGLVLVCGEKHRFERLRFDAVSSTIFGMSIGRYAESTFTAWPGGAAAFFGTPGAFIDRISIKDTFFQGSTGAGHFTYAIKSDTLSNSALINIIHHGAGVTGETGSLYVATTMQLCQVFGYGMDTLGTVGNPLTAAFDIAHIMNCTFLNTSPAFAGTVNYTYGFKIGQCTDTTWIGCSAGGNNSTNYGFYFIGAQSGSAALINCDGSCFNASANALIKAQVTQIGCLFSGGNNCGSTETNVTNADTISLQMADSSGSAAATSKWGPLFATGSGGSVNPFYVRKEGGWVNNVINFANAFGESFPQTIQALLGTTPNGNVTAVAGSLCMLFSGVGAGGVLWTKATGNGTNTGWVPLMSPTPAQAYSTNSSTSASTVLVAADIQGGADEHTLNLTGAISAASNAQLPTVAALVTLLANAVTGQSYKLRVRNSGGSGSGIWTITTNTGWTLTGAMTVAVAGYSEFYVTLTSLTTATLQTI